MESNHPIESLMNTAMKSLQDMVDVNTIIGDPIETASGVVIIPVSKVSFGFAAGGSQFNEETIEEYEKMNKDDEHIKYSLPFGGGTGGGVSINPICFIIVQDNNNVKLLPVCHSSTIDRLIDYVPELIEKVGNRINKKEEIKNEIGSIFYKKQDGVNSNNDTENDKLRNEIKEEKKSKEEKKEDRKSSEKEEKYEIEYIEEEDLDD